jgi:hypothetical protein
MKSKRMEGTSYVVHGGQKKFIQILIGKVKWIMLNVEKLDKLGIKHESVVYKYRMRDL